ncbi:flavin reductase family protein [Bradyrhizobium sp. GCM10027634]|uniref:flavin reductase family protein n=1 Tax=unclassified Bradyrhizobium TaxID=2631580 RepID=UPI00263A686F|nr:flavin reductase family protein [Bradyrhizobium sp. WYCCWR 12677]MDN5005464.1 flavin reductase family protein [Bradyrhizobium sp. WYCCWR 12677]
MGNPEQASSLRDQISRADSFKSGMRRFASGVALITSAAAGERAGLIATAVSSVSTAPPTLLVCINTNASAHAVIDRSGTFGVNLLSAGDLDLVDVFSKSARRNERFISGDWRTLITGAPMLASALASFDCQVVQRLAYETHTIFLGEVMQVKLAEDDIDPLLYMDSAFRRLEKAA